MSLNVNGLFSLFETEKVSNGEIKILFHGLALTVFKEKYGVWDPMPELTITHFISQSTPKSSTPTTKGKG